MTNQIDNWHKLARYDTNIQGELHANLLRNNDITVSLQTLSGLPGMNSGAVLWVQDIDLAQAQRILANIKTANADSVALLDEMTDAEFDAMSDKAIADNALNATENDHNGSAVNTSSTINKGGNL